MGDAVEWRLADAKNRFSELVNRALSQGPQRVTRRHDTVVVLSQQEYARRTGDRQSFKAFLRETPELSDLDLERDRSPGREVDI